jgi:hypothetical protein
MALVLSDDWIGQAAFDIPTDPLRTLATPFRMCQVVRWAATGHEAIAALLTREDKST